MNAPVKLTHTFASFNDLVPRMTVGQKIIYHVGSLMYDRLRGPSFQTAHGCALAAYQAYERGEVTLVQRKIGLFTFEYIAIKLAKKSPRNAAMKQPSR